MILRPMEDFKKAQREQVEALMVHTNTLSGCGGKLLREVEKTSVERGRGGVFS